MKEYKFTIGGKKYEVAVSGIEGNVADVSVNGVAYKVEIEEGAASAAAPVTSPAAAPAAQSAASASAPAAPAASGAGKSILSPLPGVIISVDVKEGQSVARGQKVAVIEAMKMENEILAECDGTVSGVCCAAGDSVMEGTTLVTIA